MRPGVSRIGKASVSSDKLQLSYLWTGHTVPEWINLSIKLAGGP